jgi:NAD(P)-dependent dehydrogenase (short-subunit alcohol dehydrogenase family)
MVVKARMSFSLAGKVAVVTGASRGIGEACARAFVAAGAKVVLASRKIEGLTQVAKSLGENAWPFAAHTGKEADCKALIAEAVKKFGQVDVLVNNAGTNPYFGPLLGTENAAWDKTFEVNLKGYFWCTRELANHCISRGAPGSVINIASVLGKRAAPLQGAYGMTKAAVISMTQTLAYELGPSKIRVNAIAPGLIDTKLASALVNDKEFAEGWQKRTPLARVGQPAEIAGGVLFLAGDASAYVTGEVLTIDGGLTLT